MSTEQIINLAALVLAVAAVVYGYVAKKSASTIVAEVNKTADEALQLQTTIVTNLLVLKELLEPAVRQLPKTRSKRASVEIEPSSES